MEKTTATPIRVGVTEGIVNFIQGNRKKLLIVCSILAAALVITALIVTFVESSRLKAIAEVDVLSRRYDEIRSLGDEVSRDAAVTELVTELTVFADRHGSYAGARAYILLAGIQADRNSWVEAEASWVAAAAKIPNSFLSAVSYYNAATAAEERGDISRAIELYSMSAENFTTVFPLAARAYFAVGRLHEERKDNVAALTAYRKIFDTLPNNNWTRPAMSRILALTLTTE